MNAQRRRLIADGLAAGLIGYALVVLFFVIFNVAVGRSPFYTAALIGEAVFSGLRDPANLVLAPGPILAFNGVHLGAYLLFGFFGAWLVYETELHPEFWYLAFSLFVVAAVVSYAAVVAAMAVIGTPISAWTVVAASLLAAVGMAGYLTGTHRTLRRAINEGQETRLGRLE